MRDLPTTNDAAGMPNVGRDGLSGKSDRSGHPKGIVGMPTVHPASWFRHGAGPLGLARDRDD
jgi:hypothetical protein